MRGMVGGGGTVDFLGGDGTISGDGQDWVDYSLLFGADQ